MSSEETPLMRRASKARTESSDLPSWVIHLPILLVIVCQTWQAEVLQDMSRGTPDIPQYAKPMFIVWLNHNLLAVILLFVSRHGAPYKVLMKDGMFLAFLFYLPSIFFMVSTKWMPVSLAIPIFSTSFIYVVPLAYWAFGDVPSSIQCKGLMVAVCGLACIYFGSQDSNKDSNLGVGCIVASLYAVLYAVYLVSMRTIVKSRPYPYYFATVTGWAGVMNPLLFPLLLPAHMAGIEVFEMPPASVYPILTLELLLSVVGNTCIFASVALLGPAGCAVISLAVIPFSAVVDYYVRNTIPTIYDGAGIALLCGAIILWEYGREGNNDLPEIGQIHDKEFIEDCEAGAESAQKIAEESAGKTPVKNF